jgi:hypothetical protein
VPGLDADAIGDLAIGNLGIVQLKEAAHSRSAFASGARPPWTTYVGGRA